MGQPTPPGDLPLFEGLDSSWNDIVSAFPEDKRAELAPKLKARIDEFTPLQQWGEFAKQGITPDQAGAALNLYNIIDQNPRQVYDLIGKHLGITPQQAQQVVDEIESGESDDSIRNHPEFLAMKQQVETLAQIALHQRDSTRAQQLEEQQTKALDNEITALKTKYGEDNVNEEEILMRMLHKGLSAEQAHQEYDAMVTQLRTRRPAPALLGSGGTIPSRAAIDPKKLSSGDTRSLVAQMLEHARDETRR